LPAEFRDDGSPEDEIDFLGGTGTGIGKDTAGTLLEHRRKLYDSSHKADALAPLQDVHPRLTCDAGTEQVIMPPDCASAITA